MTVNRKLSDVWSQQMNQPRISTSLWSVPQLSPLLKLKVHIKMKPERKQLAHLMLLPYRTEMKECSLQELEEMTEMFSQYGQKQKAQSASGWLMIYSAKLCLLKTFPLKVDIHENLGAWSNE